MQSKDTVVPFIAEMDFVYNGHWCRYAYQVVSSTERNLPERWRPVESNDILGGRCVCVGGGGGCTVFRESLHHLTHRLSNRPAPSRSKLLAPHSPASRSTLPDDACVDGDGRAGGGDGGGGGSGGGGGGRGRRHGTSEPVAETPWLGRTTFALRPAQMTCPDEKLKPHCLLKIYVPIYYK